jgi:hypothetical protein
MAQDQSFGPSSDVNEVLSQLELNEKISFLSGETAFSVYSLARLGIPALTVSLSCPNLGGQEY